MMQVDLSNCDREPIHIPGSIQTHGALIVCDGNLDVVSRHSSNAVDILRLNEDRRLLGNPLDQIVGRENGHHFRNGLAAAQMTNRPALFFDIAIGDDRFDVSIHRSGEETLIEFEPKVVQQRQPIDLIRSITSRIGQPDTVDALARKAARLIRATLGYDRVMIYRFEPEGSGQVIAESKAAHLESFMGQFFPASDIPQQARILYLKSTIRIISNADGARAPIVQANGPDLGPLDLSLAHLRSVSPIHCEYLRNMGVSASMSISIIIDDALWGLVACHHYSPKYLDMAERAAVEVFGELFSIQLDVLRQKRRLMAANTTRKALDRLLQEAPLHAELFDLLRNYLADFASMIPSDGMALVMNGSLCTYGLCPPVETIQNIASAAGARAGSRVWSTHIASETLGIEQTPLAAGVMMVPLSQHTRDCLLFFRREFEHTLNWAGNPNKAYSSGPLGERLTPRKSFAIWKETVRLQSRKWTETQHEVGEVIRSALVEIVLRHNEIIAEERGRADLRQRMLNEELNHRVKNILAVIKSLIGQGSFNASTIEEYLETLRGRIQALAVAHDQIVRGDGGGLIRTLLAAELKPYDEQSATVSLSGPAVWVDNSTYSVLALVFHELATNAAKYGALFVPSGQLAVRWQIDQDNNCEIFWEESGGPYVIPPTRKGFGSVLISRSIPHELGGKASLDYLPTGLEAEFMIPSRHIALADPANEESAPRRSAGGQPNRKSAQPTDVAIFLVEDQMLIAMDAEMMLSTEGLRNFRTASSVTEALSMLERFHPTVAVLDVNLGDETSIPIAAALRRMNVPFLFATGYGDGGVIPEQFQDVPVIRKPYASSELAQAIFGLLD